MSFDRLELPCIWIPEGGELPMPLPWGNPAIFPAIFIPDGYQGPPLGYPWIEFGRMTLRVGKRAGRRSPVSAATTATTRPSPSTAEAAPRAVALHLLPLARSPQSVGTLTEPGVRPLFSPISVQPCGVGTPCPTSAR